LAAALSEACDPADSLLQPVVVVIVPTTNPAIAAESTIVLAVFVIAIFVFVVVFSEMGEFPLTKPSNAHL
jgi:hypothetical protein